MSRSARASAMIALTLVLVTMIGRPASAGGLGPVTEFQHNAGGWPASTSGEQLRAFDQFLPGLNPAGCLGGTPGTTLYLPGGVITVSAFGAGGAAGCAITDGSTGPDVSDASLPGFDGASKLVLGFSPPVSAF